MGTWGSGMARLALASAKVQTACRYRRDELRIDWRSRDGPPWRPNATKRSLGPSSSTCTTLTTPIPTTTPAA